MRVDAVAIRSPHGSQNIIQTINRVLDFSCFSSNSINLFLMLGYRLDDA